MNQPLLPAWLLLGPTGAGKTPLGDLLQQRGLWGRRCVHFDFGANLREIAGRQRADEWITAEDVDFVCDVLRRGALLEDKDFPLAERILRSFLAARHADAETRVVLNGLPRHVGQARALATVVDVEMVVELVCSPETVWERIRQNTGGDRTGRADDDQESVRRKLAIYSARTAPLVEHYRTSGCRIESIEVTGQSTAEHVREILAQRGTP
jgi:adenylate kinase